MAETAEQPPVKEETKILQQQFGTLVDKLQETVGNNNLELSSHELMAFDSLYRKVPDGNHLRIGLTSSSWYRLQSGSEDLKLLTKKKYSPTGSQYYLEVARFIPTPNDVTGSRRALQPHFKGSTSDGYLGLMMISNKGYVELGAKILPQEILSIEVVNDGQKP